MNMNINMNINLNIYMNMKMNMNMNNQLVKRDLQLMQIDEAIREKRNLIIQKKIL